MPDLARLFHFLNIGLLLYMLVYFHISCLVQFVFWPCSLHLASREVLGQPAVFKEAVRYSFQRWGTHLGLALMQILFIPVIPEVASTAISIGAAFTEQDILHIDTSEFGSFSITMTVCILLGLAAYFWFSSRVFLSWPAMMREGTSIRKSLRRGRQLSRGCRRRIFVIQLLTVILWWLLNDCAIFVVRFALMTMHTGIPWYVRWRIYIVAIHLLKSSIDVFVWPILPICITLFYYDQRIRQEGFDIEMMMDRAGMNAAANAVLEEPPVSAGEPGEQPA